MYDFKSVGLPDIQSSIIIPKSSGEYFDIRLNTVGGYTCPKNKTIFHDSNGARLIPDPISGDAKFVCYSTACKHAETIIPGLKSEDAPNDTNSKRYFDLTKTMNLQTIEPIFSERYISIVKFKQAFLQNNIFVNSALGTGKTELLTNWIQSDFKDKYVVYLSARKSFTRSIIGRLNSASGIQFSNYEDSVGGIYLSDSNRGVVIQIDSLHRIKNPELIDLLVIDEFCSILTHMSSKSSSTIEFLETFTKFINLRQCTNVFLDGFLTESDINFVQNLSDKSIEIISNDYAPMTGNHITIHPISKSKSDLDVFINT